MLFKAKQEAVRVVKRPKAGLYLDLSWEPLFPHSPTKPHSTAQGPARAKPLTYTHAHTHTPSLALTGELGPSA